MIVLKLRGKTLSWPSKLIWSFSWNIMKDAFIAALKKTYDTQLSISKFTTSSSPSTREGISDLLKAEIVLLEKTLMMPSALM
jgi:hypothetical protein